jgi:general secretion pathway protein D
MAVTLPVIDFEDTTLEDAIDYLRQRFLELDPDRVPERRGVSVVVRKSRIEGRSIIDGELDADGALPGMDPEMRLITYQARDVSAWTALCEICDQAGMRVSFDEHVLTIIPRDPPAPLGSHPKAQPSPDDPFSGLDPF